MSTAIFKRTFGDNLMEEICHRDNLNKAYKRVVQNKGAPGIDNMPVHALLGWLRIHGQELVEKLKSNKYFPQPVKKVEIQKIGGGKRTLGIPTVIDRFVQQAILQVLAKIIDPKFSNNSYGFRPGKSAHQALENARKYVENGHRYVADLDIEQFFDRVNHDMVMNRLSKHIEDKCTLKLVRRFLEAGLWSHGAYEDRREGTPQGGPLSPLLANILLDDLDKELEKRGHKFCRYADDCNIYVRSQVAAERVLNSIKKFLNNKLKLKVNDAKSAASVVTKRIFLGYTIGRKATLIASDKSLKRLKGNVRQMTKRNRGVSIHKIVQEINNCIRGWSAYFKYDRRNSIYQDLDSWIRRRLRCYRLKQRKRSYPIAKWLMAFGIEPHDAWILAKSSKGWWRLSKTIQLHMSMNNAWFGNLGMLSLHKEICRLNT
jgi:RNA-directed DNA polymerase